MKHRSIGVFILLAASLFSAPQLSQELSAVKSAVGERVRAEILHAFLNLHASDAAYESAPQLRPTALASCPATEKTARQQQQPAPKREAAKAPAPSQDEPAAQPQTREQWAMLGDPASDPIANGNTRPPVLIAGLETERARELSDEQLPTEALAMIIPPGSGIDLPSVAGRVAPPEREAAPRARKSAEPRRRAAYVPARYEVVQPSVNVSEEFLRRVEFSVKERDKARAAADETRFKFLRFKRLARPAAAAPAPPAPQQPAPRQIALTSTDAVCAIPAAAVALCGE